MSRFRSVLRLFGAVAVGVAVFGLARPAQATFRVQISTDGGANFSTFPDIAQMTMGGVTFSPTGAGVFTVQGLTVTASDMLSQNFSSLVLHVDGTLTAPTTFDLVIRATVDNVPTVPPGLKYVFTRADSANVGTNLTETIETWLNASNALFGMTGPGDTGAQNPSASGFLKPNVSSAYSLTTEIRIKGTMSTSPFSISLDSNNTVTPTPAPTGVVLALSGLPIWLYGLRVRRRREPLTG